MFSRYFVDENDLTRPTEFKSITDALAYKKITEEQQLEKDK